MTSQTEKAKAKLTTLSISLDDLEAHLEPLFAQTLPETVLGLEPIQQAKLQTVLPYLVYDLVFSACRIPVYSLSVNPDFRACSLP
jgi:exosome complex protein LRP1